MKNIIKVVFSVVAILVVSFTVNAQSDMDQCPGCPPAVGGSSAPKTSSSVRPRPIVRHNTTVVKRYYMNGTDKTARAGIADLQSSLGTKANTADVNQAFNDRDIRMDGIDQRLNTVEGRVNSLWRFSDLTWVILAVAVIALVFGVISYFFPGNNAVNVVNHHQLPNGHVANLPPPGPPYGYLPQGQQALVIPYNVRYDAVPLEIVVETNPTIRRGGNGPFRNNT